MAWYKTGSVSITSGQTTVTGIGTNFASNVRVGDGFKGPNGLWYEIVNVASQTVLGIFPAYAGPTVTANTNYMVAPLQGYNKESADRLRAITDSLPNSLDTKQDKSANLTSFSTLVGAANRIPMFTGAGALSLAVLTATQTANELTFKATDILRAGEAGYAARREFGFYATGTTDPTLNIDTVPGGWCGLVSNTVAGTMPPLTGGFFWIETQQTYSGMSSVQTAFQYGGGATDPNNANLSPSMAIRIRNQPGTVWGPWGKIYTSRDGDVSFTTPLNGTPSVNLNTLRTARTDYYITNGINTPTGGNGYLTVIPLAGTTECYQRYTIVNGSASYERTQLSGNWSAWTQIIRAGDFGIGSQNVPQITDFAADIKPGFYYSYGAAHASAPANGPVGSGGGAVGVVAMQGINNIGYKSFLAVSQQGGSGALFFGSKVIAGAPTWSRVLTQETANLDPALNTGGVISSTVVSGYTITKFFDGFLTIQGIESGTAVIPANAISTLNITIPAVIANLTLTNVVVNATPSSTNDFTGVTNALMTSGTNCRFTIKNGGTAQSFIPRITILSRWK